MAGTQLQCLECGKRFVRRLTWGSFDIECPKCGGGDTEPVHLAVRPPA